jgi:hypothetical protein
MYVRSPPWRMAGAGLHDLYELNLVPTDDDAVIAADNWLAIQHRLLEQQPTTSACLVGEPHTTIHVVA